MEADSHYEETNDSVISQHKNSADCLQVDNNAAVRLNHDESQGASIETARKSENNSNGIFHQSVITEHVSSFPAIHSQQSITNENYTICSNKITTHQSNLTCGLSQATDPTTSIESKSFQSTITKTVNHIPTTELLNINEDAHSGPMNVFEFDGLQILVPSTFISESSQKAISATSQQSMASSEGGTGIDEEVKSVNMRADETMPPRGELSEQESNGCTEHSAWQLYVGQESSRMSTSYDLMARESWEESEGSDNEAGVPLLDSRSLATHFTSSLFLDRDRKTPTKQRTFKCSQCTEVFDCPKERRVHSTTVHKEAGPSNSCSNSGINEQSETKDIKLLDGPMNPFEDIFVPGLHVQQGYQQQQPLLHQMQPPQQLTDISKVEADEKSESLALTQGIEISCAMCTQRFSSERSLQMHNRRVHGTEVARRLHDISKCQICNEEFPSVALFNAHLKIHPLECSQCGKYFYRKQNFKLHMKRHLGIKPFPCTICDKAFLTKQKLDEHTNGHTGNAPVKCNLCNETFRRYSNLTQHKNRHHLNIKRKLKDYICHCGEVFHTKKKLAWHKETHDDKPKACTYCNERFIHMASLTRHMRRAHNRRFVPDAQRENENVECPICKCIYLRSSLSVHMRVHNGERPYECQVCSKAFSTKWNLQLHKWTHAARSTKPFKCNQCSAAFYRHSDYTAHMNSHRNVRPYTCNYCGAQFIRKYNCLRHVKEHEENKAYTCDVCNKTFHRSYYLKEHLRVHSGARPYTCHICGKSSSTKSNHNKHVRIHHAREPVNTEN
ncbi:zinc finger protein 221 [Cotesia glomerata]|uniref:zinc finger protein 221 n=1 Tax=Cotesia glomerata TaxID=32391 RepID=UPI001D0161F4|nr:zinc finger protein 221 [Cotesia glomerata]